MSPFSRVGQMSIVPGHQLFYFVHRGKSQMKGITPIIAKHRQVPDVKLSGLLNLLDGSEQWKIFDKLKPLRSPIRVACSQFVKHHPGDVNIEPGQVICPPLSSDQVPGVNYWIWPLFKPTTRHGRIQVDCWLHDIQFSPIEPPMETTQWP